MRPTPRSPVTTGLDVSLLGFIVAAVGFYGGRLAASAGASPNLVRFGDASAGTRMPAAMPQDNALLLLAGSGGDGGSAAGTGSGVLGALDPVWSFLVLVGLTMVVAGPLWAWIQL